ncbi:MAG: hypothetical protein EOO06_10700 [Chitinophagaceae bacterium]|nr:MAG: hypothetical protein EOO06_10700 [Chitinophagaceae bacterium]
MFISDDSSWIIRKQALEQLHAFFVAAGALDAHNTSTNESDKALVAGKAIAPSWAAMCLFDIARTRQFVLGLKAAIADMIEMRQRRIYVLDAGCGPYGLLSMIAALYFEKEEVHFTLLDIFEENIRSVSTLIKAISLEDRFDFICEDALVYQWPNLRPLDIVVTETMNAALSKEPQVGITLQLAAQLSQKGILIPEKIEVDLIRQPANDSSNCPAGERISKSSHCLGNIVTLTKTSSLPEFRQPLLKSIELPSAFSINDQLEMQTNIQVYKQYGLGKNESAITLPSYNNL